MKINTQFAGFVISLLMLPLSAYFAGEFDGVNDGVVVACIFLAIVSLLGFILTSIYIFSDNFGEDK